MGSNTLVTAKEKKEKCKVCQLKFITLAGLVSHQNAKHPEVKNRENNEKANNTPTARVSKRIQLKKVEAESEDIDSDLEISSAENPATKTEFKCPKCDKIFPLNFQAVKHIQKKHCIDDEGIPVSKDSPDLIKPLSVEKCLNCNKHFDLDASHRCLSTNDQINPNTFNCLGCSNTYSSLVGFHKHVVHIHHENMDNMFFKTLDEFELWKKRMETIVKMKYLTLNKGIAYKYFTCNYVSPKNTFNSTYLCPSLIMAKNLETGIQIHYNKTHCEHSCPKYEVPKEFLQYLTNKCNLSGAFDTLIDKKEPEDDDDLYRKYYVLMGNIRKDAVRVDITLLKTLFESALKMQALINSSEEEDENKDEDSLFRKSMTDDQITNILEEKRSSARLKRKGDSRSSIDNKKTKVDDFKSKIDKSVSKENKIFDSSKVKPKSIATVSPSFNDSYKQFINSNDSKHDLNKSKIGKRKEIVKTKIGQFSPKKKISNADDNELKRSPKIYKSDEISPKKKLSSTDEKVELKRTPNILRPSITNTKDIQYEVRERNNGCNILILKI